MYGALLAVLIILKANSMAHLIDKDALVAEIDERIKAWKEYYDEMRNAECYTLASGAYLRIGNLEDLKKFLNTLEAKEADLYNNGWIDCEKQMPKETKQTSDTLQGHHEWTESDLVLVWDSHYGAGIDSTRNGKWRSEQKGGYTGQICHDIIAWRPIPNFSEELLLKAR